MSVIVERKDKLEIGSEDCIRVGLVNNMPDAAVEDTEAQFYELLDSASGDTPVRLSLFTLPDVPRGERALEHLKSSYSSVNELWSSRVDAIIVTGTEPRQPDLRNEPYWPALTRLLDWAERNTSSTILSCLAAHAGVLYSDGIKRQPLPDKRFGVFEFSKVSEHPLTSQARSKPRFPHSRWNDLSGDALRRSGYTVLTESPEAGVDSFVKQKGKSLFVHFQGHPEYDAQTLMREYRRDVRRFLRRERETYPNLPDGYFGQTAASALQSFRRKIESDRREELMSEFPEAAALDGLTKSWDSSAKLVYRNWLTYLASQRTDHSRMTSTTEQYSEMKL